MSRHLSRGDEHQLRPEKPLRWERSWLWCSSWLNNVPYEPLVLRGGGWRGQERWNVAASCPLLGRRDALRRWCQMSLPRPRPTSVLASKHASWPTSSAAGQVPPTPYTYPAVRVHTEHFFFFFPLTQILIFFPQRAASLRLREAHYFTGVPPLFSPTEEEEEVGQPGRRAAQGCVQAHSGSTGTQTGSTQLTRRKMESASFCSKLWVGSLLPGYSPRVIFTSPNSASSFACKSPDRAGPRFY